ncbi:hypothetical protein AKO1_004410, partial [Acrasis kona]
GTYSSIKRFNNLNAVAGDFITFGVENNGEFPGNPASLAVDISFPGGSGQNIVSTNLNWTCTGTTTGCMPNRNNCSSQPSKAWMSSQTCGTGTIEVSSAVTGLSSAAKFIWVSPSDKTRTAWCKVQLPLITNSPPPLCTKTAQTQSMSFTPTPTLTPTPTPTLIPTPTPTLTPTSTITPTPT